jgi:hypothetical protein
MTNFQPTPGWQSIIPRYRASRDIRPAEKERFRFEPPFTTIFNNDVWQYGEQPLVQGDEIETTAWPHASFRPLNYSAERTLAFFNLEMKSRLTKSPWHEGRLRLDNGISDAPPIEIRTIEPQPMNLRPVA